MRMNHGTGVASCAGSLLAGCGKPVRGRVLRARRVVTAHEQDGSGDPASRWHQPDERVRAAERHTDDDDRPRDALRSTTAAASNTLRWWASRFPGIPRSVPNSCTVRSPARSRSTIRNRLSSPNAEWTLARSVSRLIQSKIITQQSLNKLSRRLSPMSTSCRDICPSRSLIVPAGSFSYRSRTDRDAMLERTGAPTGVWTMGIAVRALDPVLRARLPISPRCQPTRSLGRGSPPASLVLIA